VKAQIYTAPEIAHLYKLPHREGRGLLTQISFEPDDIGFWFHEGFKKS
jgi:hypothetical protein